MPINNNLHFKAFTLYFPSYIHVGIRMSFFQCKGNSVNGPASMDWSSSSRDCVSGPYTLNNIFRVPIIFHLEHLASLLCSV